MTRTGYLEVVEGSPSPSDAFERLAPALQYHIVNLLEWPSLRPVQAAAIHAVMDGANCVVIAPTAGGKTEAALLPLLSMMDAEDWVPASVLYVAPIRALLNNLEPRLDSLSALVGRRSFKWHGDVSQAARQRAIRERTDIIAITPESLEAMMISTRVPAPEILANVRVIVVDEVHAFASDDRGAHLAALMERIQRLAGRDLQRIGLSATVGNPEEICCWMSGSSRRVQRVVRGEGEHRIPDIAVDCVGSLGNAAIVIDRLHRGRKRLVFADSRRRVEELGHLLSKRGVDTHLAHSSLALAERRAAEEAFEQGENCVIVATSALELGIDVGDLDHVLQIDAPVTVAGFLQRMGRTGRRPGTSPNCTFLATSDDALLHSVALVRLFDRGFVEPVLPSRRAVHILAHQVLALTLQLEGAPATGWWDWVDGCFAFADVTTEDRVNLVQHMMRQDIVCDVDQRVVLGPRGESLYGHRHFLDLYAVFSTPPEIKVVFQEQEIGTIDRFFVEYERRGPLTFVLAGKPWLLEHVDWKRGVCYVTPAQEGDFPSWSGSGRLLSRELCQSMLGVLRDDVFDPWLSARSREALERVRDEFWFVRDPGTPLVSHGGIITWWNFAGGRANTVLANVLDRRLGSRVAAGNTKIVFSSQAALDVHAVRSALEALRQQESWHGEEFLPSLSTSARERLSKFQVCLPPQLQQHLIAERTFDVEGARETVQQSLRVVTLSD